MMIEKELEDLRYISDETKNILRKQNINCLPILVDLEDKIDAQESIDIPSITVRLQKLLFNTNPQTSNETSDLYDLIENSLFSISHPNIPKTLYPKAFKSIKYETIQMSAFWSWEWIRKNALSEVHNVSELGELTRELTFEMSILETLFSRFNSIILADSDNRSHFQSEGYNDREIRGTYDFSISDDFDNSNVIWEDEISNLAIDFAMNLEESFWVKTQHHIQVINCSDEGEKRQAALKAAGLTTAKVLPITLVNNLIKQNQNEEESENFNEETSISNEKEKCNTGLTSYFHSANHGEEFLVKLRMEFAQIGHLIILTVTDLIATKKLYITCDEQQMLDSIKKKYLFGSKDDIESSYENAKIIYNLISVELHSILLQLMEVKNSKLYLIAKKLRNYFANIVELCMNIFNSEQEHTLNIIERALKPRYIMLILLRFLMSIARANDHVSKILRITRGSMETDSLIDIFMVYSLN